MYGIDIASHLCAVSKGMASRGAKNRRAEKATAPVPSGTLAARTLRHLTGEHWRQPELVDRVSARLLELLFDLDDQLADAPTVTSFELERTH